MLMYNVTFPFPLDLKKCAQPPFLKLKPPFFTDFGPKNPLFRKNLIFGKKMTKKSLPPLNLKFQTSP